MSNKILLTLREQIEEIIIGQSSIVEQLLVALLSSGHVILEGVPGIGKTLLVKVISRLIQADFKRIQLTPDILPSDILGTSIFDFNTRSFTLKQGPIFTDILLADEINRTPPKTQAALLEAMEERQVSLDGETIALSEFFWVIATQNSLEFEGTYPLPEAQLDRFLFKLLIGYPERQAEKKILLNVQSKTAVDLERLEPIATMQEIINLRQEVQSITVEESILDYILSLIESTRKSAELVLGASPRAAVAWLKSSKAQAYLKGHSYVTPDHVKAVAFPLLIHRLILHPEALLDGIKIDSVISSILKKVPVPR